MAIVLEVATPEGVALESVVDGATLPTEMGELGILPGHVPLAGIVVPGLLRFVKNGERESMAIDGGFFILQSDVLSILVDGAISVAEIDPTEAEQARRRAEETLARAKLAQVDAAEIAQLEAKIRYQIIKKQAHNRH
ncbi:MAG: ATP synthase F1 subunit epsilon [Puniceicoccales bacterium]|jgi:F-type H+-transporting ATPase subunit epsilon|nr:ATP synthase F1 subunit epsilon [Puniceicoccales bacterium]